MATFKKYDVVVKVGEFTNSKGETKPRYENIGSVMEKDDGGRFMLLKRTFNPAGVPNHDDKDSIMCSFFEDKGNNQQSEQSPAQAKHSEQKSNGYQKQAGDIDDDLPF